MSIVSVIIPCYRYGRFLEEAVSSVIDDQEGVDVRVLIIDDASPDDSADVARGISARDPRVEVVTHETNRGNIATFNEGLLEWADGDYCLLMSADDRATPGALRRASDLMDAHPQVGFVYGRARWFTDGSPLPPARTRVRGWSIWTGRKWLEHRFRQAENPIMSPEILVRTTVQRRVGGYDARLPRAADMEMYMRLAAHADVGFLRGVDQAYYRQHTENMSKAVSPLMDLQNRRAVLEAVLQHKHDAVKDAKRLSGLAHQQLGMEALWAAGRVYQRGEFRQSDLGWRLLGAGANIEHGGIEDLLEFATECWPDAERTPIYRTLQSRGTLGTRELMYMLDRKAHWWLRRRSWKYRGY